MIDESRTVRVAIIGAGPAGLAVAHELLKEGHSVTIFETSDAVGGAWHFDSSIDSDPLALDPNRRKVHSSMYQGLRTNLPRSIMSFLDFPFIPEAMRGLSHDPRMYPLHTEVLAYYRAFAEACDLNRHIQLNTTVCSLDPLQHTSTEEAPSAATEATAAGKMAKLHITSHGSSGVGTYDLNVFSHNVGHVRATSTATLQWRLLTETRSHSTAEGDVASTSQGSGNTPDHSQQQQQWRLRSQTQQQPEPQQRELVFDAVASCVGIFSEPNLPQVEGMAAWPGLQLHSHNYRSPEQFSGKKVLVVGASFSGEEIARAIATTAAHVYHSARTFTGPGTARERKQAAAASCACCPAGHAAPHQQQQYCADTPLHEPQQQQQQQQADPLKPWTTQRQQPVLPAPEPRHNIERVPLLLQLLADGSAVLQGGRVLHDVDAVVYCTGYKYSYPWMEHLGIVDTDGGHVRPLYLHMFPPAYAPSLALVGLPWRCAKLPQFQLQGQLLARLLSGKAFLPPMQEMIREQQLLFAAMAAEGIPRRYTHCQADFMPENQWKYADKLISLAAGAAFIQQRQQRHNNDAVQAPVVLQQQEAGTQPSIRQEQQQQQQQQQQQEQYQEPDQQQEEPEQQQQEQQQQQQEPGSARSCQPGLQLQQVGWYLQSAGHQYHRDHHHHQQQQQKDRLLQVPDWLKAVADVISGDILSRPDTFRDAWSYAAEAAMQAAHKEMLRLWGMRAWRSLSPAQKVDLGCDVQM